MDATVDLRRQRDAICHEMEQLVRTMQRLEPDVDQKRPGWEAKRDELAQHRQRLSELRGKMRSVMDAAASVSSSTAANTSALTPPPGAGRQLFSAPASAAAHQVSPLRRTSISPPREQSPRRYASASANNFSENISLLSDLARMTCHLACATGATVLFCGLCGIGVALAKLAAFTGSGPQTNATQVRVLRFDPEHVVQATAEQTPCVVCSVNVPDCVLLPCTHQVLCNRCANVLNACPICRSYIEERFNRFLP